MAIHFEEVSPEGIRESRPSSYHPKARYFRAVRDGKPLCVYGVIGRTETAGEAFLILDTLRGRVFGKGLLTALVAHGGSLGYGEVWTWTEWDRLIKVLGRFRSLGVERATAPPPWEASRIPPKPWFVKRLKKED